MLKLNPWAKDKAALLAKQEKDRHAKRAAALKAKRNKEGRKAKGKRTSRYQQLHSDLVKSFKDAQDKLDEEEREGNYVPGDSGEDED